jgi:DNA polymerase-4/DNA polymerase V
MQPLCLRAFPRAIIHIDADAFFASCEQAVNPRLKGKPVVTGKERGIASAVSYEAKALGIKRGMTIREIKRICPTVIHLPSDYETYSLFSQRMFAIVRRALGHMRLCWLIRFCPPAVPLVLLECIT